MVGTISHSAEVVTKDTLLLSHCQRDAFDTFFPGSFMIPRDHQLMALRPEISQAVVTSTMADEEIFQNQTLRPILKWQNELLLSVFRHYAVLRKNVFFELPDDQRPLYITQALKQDAQLRHTLKGMVIGQFTLDEFARYAAMARALDKRMLGLITQRLHSQVAAIRLPD